MAWLSSTTSNPAVRFMPSSTGYARVDGVMVASSWADLIDGSLAAPINRDEYNNEILYDLVWTATDATGIMSGRGCIYSDTCIDWTYGGSAGECAVVGSPSATTEDWTTTQYTSTCHSSNRLYCFQQ